MITYALQNIKSAHTSSFFGSVCALFVIGACMIGPQVSRAESIESFVSDITVKQDASFTIREEITYAFTGEKHGIFRCIPIVHAEKASSIFKERYIDIGLVKVEMDTQTVPYTETTSNGKFCIKIGDPNTTVSGTHTYAIEYTVGGAITYETFGGAELYWDVTGNEWEVPIQRVEANVYSEDSLLLRERSCYRGKVGETDSCDSVTKEDGTVQFTGSVFDPYEGLTLAQALNRSKIPLDVRERLRTELLGVVVGVFVLLGGVIALYRYKTEFKTERTIIPQYEPYPGVKPMYAGYLFDKQLDPRDIAAAIVYLAKQGFIRIKKVDRKVLFLFEVSDFEIELIRAQTEIGDAFERQVLGLIFEDTAEVGSIKALSELKSNLADMQKNRLILLNLRRQMKQDLKEQEYFVGFNFTTIFTTSFIVGTFILGILFSFISSGFVIFVIIVCVVILGFLIEGRRTRKGYEALDHLKGFKDFLRVTEKQRYIFHNAPERNAEQFMEYLPYAIAFGVEKEWAKTFEGITIPNPSWYDGGGGVGTFNAVSLTQSLGGFSTAFAASSGASASSGGGSSGGGSGGGGGGSW